MNELTEIPEVTFRRIPQGGEGNYGFLNFFLPTQPLAQKVHQALGENGVDACFYWYDNNWHYYRKWEHLKDGKALGKLPKEVREGLQDFSNTNFEASDHWVGRTISCLIKLGWTVEEVQLRANKMKEVILAEL